MSAKNTPVRGSGDFGKKLSKALNLPKNTLAVTIRADAREFVEVDIKTRLGFDEAEALLEVLKGYRLVEIPNQNSRPTKLERARKELAAWM